jgi:cleavage stimulation factor subunit 2
VKGRPLRIDLADSDPFLEGKTTNRGELDGLLGASATDSQQPSSLKAPNTSAIPPGIAVPPGATALDVISNVIATMRPAQLMEVMGHMKVG